ncbi:MAG: pilus assembly protein N-terminal domain-containing protein [Gemmataceae bacterium]|nr:pilus assembly protein N-terminal domain-containing protein [Gemmataceae bacterium]
MRSRLRMWMTWGVTLGSLTFGLSTVRAQSPANPQAYPPNNQQPSRPVLPDTGRPIFLPGQPGKSPEALLPVPKPLDPPPAGARTTSPFAKKATDPVLGQTPRPNAKTAEKIEKYIGPFIDAEASIDLIQNQTRLLILKETPKRLQISDEGFVEYNFLTKDQVTLQGRGVGTTVMTLWFTDPKDPSKEDILTLHLRVLPDSSYKERLERVYKTLQDQINCAFPDSVVCLHVVGDKLVVTGQVKDIAESTKILQIIRANAPSPGSRGMSNAANIPADRQKAGRDPNSPTEPVGQPVTPGYDEYMIDGASWIVNMLKVPGEQTVNLRVTIAEVNRTAARSIGANFTLINNQGMPYFASNAGLIATGGQSFNNILGGGGIGLAAGLGNGNCIPMCPGIPAGVGGFNNLPFALDNGQVKFAVSALRNLNYAKLMAEPNLTTINGQTANFQAGGQFPVPVLAGGGGGFGFGLQGVQFKNYGIDINFTPYITDRDRIRLVLNADVTGLDVASGTANIGGTQIPYMNQRRVNTTVEMREGQTLAVAGLIQNSASGDSHKTPLFGDIPILGQLFGFSRVSAGEQELVILVQPELVHPLDCRDRLPLPGQDLFEPTDCEFYLFGRIESHRDVDFRSPIRSDWQRIKNYRAMEANFIAGPTGYCDTPGGCSK